MPATRTRTLPILICVILALLAAKKASAETTFRSTTSVIAWEEDGATDTQGNLHLDLSSSGRFGGWRLDLDGYGRVSAGGGEEPARDDDIDRLYTLLLAASSEGGSQVAIGRQQVSAPTGPAFYDGLRFQIGQSFRMDGRWGLVAHPSEGQGADTAYLGLGFDADLREGMALGVDYARTYETDRLLKELLAADWYYSWFRYTKAYFHLNYDLMSRTLHETTVGSRLFFSESFTLQVEYRQSVPTFESDSIYSVFAVDAAEAATFAMLFTPTRNLRYTWEYALESYGEGSGGRRYGVNGSWSSPRTQVGLGLEQHRGFGGSLTEITTSVFARFLPWLRMGVSGEFDRTENHGEDTVGSYAARFTTEFSYARSGRLTLTLEQSQDDYDTEPARLGRLALSMEL